MSEPAERDGVGKPNICYCVPSDPHPCHHIGRLQGQADERARAAAVARAHHSCHDAEFQSRCVMCKACEAIALKIEGVGGE